MPFANPRRRRRRSRSWFSLNHRRRHHRRHHRRNHIISNPGFGDVAGGATMLFKRPMDLVMAGTVGSASAFLAIAIPNWLLPYPGAGMMDKVLRFASRAAMGGILYTVIKQAAPRYAIPALTGVTIAVGGGTILDLFGITLAIGRGDTELRPGQLIPTQWPGFTGYGAYTRPMGAIAAPRYGQFGAYTPRQVAFRGIHGPGSMGVAGEMGSRLYG